MKLKQSNINTISTGKADAIIFDDDLPGFGLRIREGGSRNFICQYKLGNQQRRLTIGPTERWTVEAARAEARRTLAKVDLGGDPAGDKAAARAPVSELSLGAITERFLAYQGKRLRPSSYKSAKLYLDRYLQPLHGKRIDQITRADIAARLSILAEKSGVVTADRVRSNISSLFSWAIGEGLVDANPVIGTNKHAEDVKPRDRVLTDAELVAVWNAVSEVPVDGYADAVRLLMLTAARANEIGELRWSEVDLDARTITLPAERVKNKNAFVIPLSDAALDILKSQPRGDRKFVFGPRDGGIRGWSKPKRDLDALVKIPAWRVHDLRRSAATGMAELGVQPHIVEACLNHLLSHLARTYNKATYLSEKREALNLWANHLAVVLAKASGANVVEGQFRKVKA